MLIWNFKNQDLEDGVDVPICNGLSGRSYDKYNKIPYDNLSRWCQNRQGQTIVCEQDGETWLPFEPFRTIKTTEGKNGKKRGKEVVWINGAFNENS